MVIACDVHPLNNLRVPGYWKVQLDADQDQINQWNTRWIVEGLFAFEQLASRHAKATNFFGSTETLVDICLVPHMWNARSTAIDLSTFPQLASIDQSKKSDGGF